MTNPFKDIIDRKEKARIIYEDEAALAFLPENASVPGEVVLIPKKPYSIMEQIPDEVLEHLFTLAKRLSDVCFEILSGQGTNILIHNGVTAGQEVPHFSIRILPRRKEDGLNMKWSSEKEDEGELDSVHNILTAETKNIFISAMKAKHKPIEKEVKEEKKEIDAEAEDTDYRLDFLKEKYD